MARDATCQTVIFGKYRDVLTVAEAADALNIGKSSVYKLVNYKAITSIRVGKRY